MVASTSCGPRNIQKYQRLLSPIMWQTQLQTNHMFIRNRWYELSKFWLIDMCCWIYHLIQNCLFSHLIYLEHLFHKLRHVIFTKITDFCNGHFGGVACNKAAVDLNRASKLAIWRRVQIISTQQKSQECGLCSTRADLWSFSGGVWSSGCGPENSGPPNGYWQIGNIFVENSKPPNLGVYCVYPHFLWDKSWINLHDTPATQKSFGLRSF